MKMIPLLFQTEMIQAIINGHKFQTRRLRGLQEINKDPDALKDRGFYARDDKGRIRVVFQNVKKGGDIILYCPFGKPGDTLWVRETFYEHGFVGNYLFKADGHNLMTDYDRWKPGIHMSFDACRIFLRIKNIKVQRIQDISQEDAKAEGVDPAPHRCPGWENELKSFTDCYRCSFRFLWNKIHGPAGYGWDNCNPWVWAIEFEVISTTGNPDPSLYAIPKKGEKYSIKQPKNIPIGAGPLFEQESKKNNLGQHY